MNIKGKLEKALANIEANQSMNETVEFSWHELLLLKRLVLQDDVHTNLLTESVNEVARLRSIVKDF